MRDQDKAKGKGPYNRQKTRRLTRDEQRQLRELAEQGKSDVYKAPPHIREGFYIQNLS